LAATLIFDLDGTLVDSKPGIVACFRHTFAALNRPCPSDDTLTASIGLPFRNAFAQLLDTMDAETIEQAVQIYRQRYAAVGWYEASVYEGVPATLAALGGPAFIATSKAQVFAERVAMHFGLKKYFHGIYGPDLSGLPTGKVALVEQLLRTELIGGHAVMIGDRAEDMRAAARNGITGVGVLWGYGSERELRDAGAAAVCGAPSALGACLGALEKLANAPVRGTD
jgi:phosphoglycolate phosphatase